MGRGQEFGGLFSSTADVDIKLLPHSRDHIGDFLPLLWQRVEFLPALAALGRYFRQLYVEVVKVEETLHNVFGKGCEPMVECCQPKSLFGAVPNAALHFPLAPSTLLSPRGRYKAV